MMSNPNNMNLFDILLSNLESMKDKKESYDMGRKYGTEYLQGKLGAGVGRPDKECEPMDWSKCKTLGELLAGASRDNIENLYTDRDIEVSPKMDKPDMIKYLGKKEVMLLVAGLKKEDLKLTFNEFEVKVLHQDKLIYTIESNYPVKSAQGKFENGYLTVTIEPREDANGTIE